MMGIISGCCSYYAWEDFGVRHSSRIMRTIKIKSKAVALRDNVSASMTKTRFYPASAAVWAVGKG